MFMWFVTSTLLLVIVGPLIIGPPNLYSSSTISCACCGVWHQEHHPVQKQEGSRYRKQSYSVPDGIMVGLLAVDIFCIKAFIQSIAL